MAREKAHQLHLKFNLFFLARSILRAASTYLVDVKKQYERVPGRDVVINYTGMGGCRIMANDLLKEVFMNLVCNAIKHSQGPMKVDITLSPVEETINKYYKVMIEDTGPGMPDNVKAQTLNRFEPGKHTRGKGLGLYLVRTLVDDHHGTIRVEDHIAGDHRYGTRFIVTLPALKNI